MAPETRNSADEVRIANRATYWPFAPIDVVVAAPVVARFLIGTTLAGRVAQAAALGAYLGTAAVDWHARRGVRKIDFRREFGADARHLTPISREEREEEIARLVSRLNDEFVATRIPRRELAALVDRHLTDYIASVTGQRVQTSAEVRNFTLAQLVFPFALGACDFLSGDVAIFRDMGPLEPHIIAHEFCHRKGYWRELDAQVLAYLALTASDEPVLVQSALCERLHRNVRVLAGDDSRAFHDRMTSTGLRAELLKPLLALRPTSPGIGRPVEAALRKLYDERMRLTGQNGLSDYDLGFTNFLYTFEVSRTARQRPPAAGALR
jgi:hypothetical protein